jgi:hypothetical protein
LQKRVDEDSVVRDRSSRSQNEKIRKTREKIANLSKTKTVLTIETQSETVQREMDDCNSARLWNEWPSAIEQKATSVTMEAADWHRSSDELRRVLEGYKQHFGLSADAIEEQDGDDAENGSGATTQQQSSTNAVMEQ